MSYQYPQYRKLSNDKSYYKIESNTRMLELQSIGSQWNLFELTATILPERNLIVDLIEANEAGYQQISEDDFLNVMNAFLTQSVK